MPIQLAGLGGFDATGVIGQLVQIARQPLAALDKQRGIVDSASVTMNAFSSKLSALKGAAAALSTASGFSSMAATATDGAIVPSVAGAPPPGSYTIEVTALARAQKSRSGAQASATAALGQAGDLTLQFAGGDPVTISVVATDSLSSIASKIAQSGARVSAGVINAGGSYRLSVQGLDTGAESAFSFTEGGSVSLGLADPASVVETAEDARLSVDGLQVTQSTNQIKEVVPGLTLALTKTTSAPVTVRVSPDSAALKTKINAFVNAYNDVVNAGHAAAGYGAQKAANSVLAADMGIRRALDRISSIVSGIVPNASASFRSLGSVGVSLTRDGALTLDGARLDAALAKDPEAVGRLFVTDAASGAMGLMKTLGEAIDGLVSGNGGAVKSRLEALSAQSKRLVDARALKETRIADYEQQLRRQFAGLDQAMSRYQAMSGSIAGLLANSTKT